MPLFPACVRFRASEWVLTGFYLYVAALTPFFKDRVELHDQPFFILVGALIVFCGFSVAQHGRFARQVSCIRDWIPLPLTLLAFREMGLFLPAAYDLRYESAWIQWDRIVLHQWGLRAIVESLGPVIPIYLELCYFFVYGVGAYCVVVLYLRKDRQHIDLFYVLYLLGTLISYGLFPYFPSEPPRIAFPHAVPPHFSSWIRELNLVLLNRASIRSSVFPSAHVSSAFAGAWAMFLLLPGRKPFAWGMLFYAISVAVATVYGRYHYFVDVLAGVAVSLIPAFVAVGIHLRRHGGAAHRGLWSARHLWRNSRKTDACEARHPKS